jgi:hypothetical protein
MNEAMLIMHIHKLYNKEDIPWVQLVCYTHYATGEVPHATVEKGLYG